MSCISLKGCAIMVMIGRRAIEAYAQQKVVLTQEARPFRVQREAIGLHTVGDDLARRTVSPLQRYHLPEETQPRQGGFAALPAKTGLAPVELHPLLDERIEHFRAHAMAALFPVGIRRPVMVETVCAVQIAVARNRLDEQAAGLRTGGHLRSSAWDQAFGRGPALTETVRAALQNGGGPALALKPY